MSWEHLQDVWLKVHNRRVRSHFRDLVSDPDNLEAWRLFFKNADISIPRHSLVTACYINDNDTADMTILRTLLFWVVLGQASSLHPPLYTMPSDRYQQSIKYAPQVVLYFKEDSDDVEEGFAPIDAEISFRVRDETSESFTEANAQILANKIKLKFATGAGYRWKKGRVKLSYRDKDNGYQFSVNAFSDSEGKNLIRDVLSLQSDSLDLDKLTISELGDLPPTLPPMQRVYGKQRRAPRRRPVGHVRFYYAELHLWGLPKPITLVDRSGRRRDALIRA
jgi:hypothetical protein